MADEISSHMFDELMAELARLKARVASLEKAGSSQPEAQARSVRRPTPPPLPTAKPAGDKSGWVVVEREGERPIVVESPVKPEPVEPAAVKPTALKPAPVKPVPQPGAVSPLPAAPKVDKPAPRPPEKVRAAKPGGATLEQTLGTRWMLLVGAAVLLLSAVFFFKYAIEKGWIPPLLRVIAGAVVGLALIGLGERLLRRGMRLYAGTISAVGIVLLYMVVFVASPNGLYPELEMLGTSPAPAFLLMCVVSAIGMAVSLRSNMETTALLSVLGALATPVLLSSGVDHQIVLMSYLLIIDAAFLVVALRKKWRWLAPVAFVGTALLFVAWFLAHYSEHNLSWVYTSAFSWALFAVFSE